MKNDYLPMNRNDMSIRGWKQCDFVYVSGDAYVDHPSFGTAIISRLLEARGYKVGRITKPASLSAIFIPSGVRSEEPDRKSVV